MFEQLNNPQLMQQLQKEIPILIVQIRALYAKFDKKFHLNGANIPITFGFDKDLPGSYTQTGNGKKEHFYFSLYFVGYSLENPLSMEDRLDLYKLDKTCNFFIFEKNA